MVKKTNHGSKPLKDGIVGELMKFDLQGETGVVKTSSIVPPWRPAASLPSKAFSPKR